jgi:multicomponent Na+:H+ antiporter subunit D
MLAAMALLAFVCIFLGVYPQPLYEILPFGAVEFHAYTFEHTLNQFQLLMFSALAFFMLLPLLKRTETISIDTDWFYRKGGRLFYRFCQWAFDGINDWANRIFAQQFPKLLAQFFDEPGGNLQKYAYRLWVESSGLDGDHARIEQSIDSRSRNAAYPIGVGVLLAVLILALVSFVLYLK